MRVDDVTAAHSEAESTVAGSVSDGDASALYADNRPFDVELHAVGEPRYAADENSIRPLNGNARDWRRDTLASSCLDLR